MSGAPRNREAGRFPGLNEEKLLAILDAIPARVAFIDRDRHHLYANREHAEALGVPVDEIAGRTIAEILGEEYFEKLKPFGERALAGETVEWEGWLHSPKLGDRYARRVYKPYVQPDGTIDGYFPSSATGLTRGCDRRCSIVSGIACSMPSKVSPKALRCGTPRIAS